MGEILLDLSNFQITVEKKDKKIQHYIKLLKLTKIKYQKFFEENKRLTEKCEILKKNNKEKIENK